MKKAKPSKQAPRSLIQLAFLHLLAMAIAFIVWAPLAALAIWPMWHIWVQGAWFVFMFSLYIFGGVYAWLDPTPKRWPVGQREEVIAFGLVLGPVFIGLLYFVVLVATNRLPNFME